MVGADRALAQMDQSMKSETTLIFVSLLRALVARQEHVLGMMGPGLDAKWRAQPATTSTLRMLLELVAGAGRACAQMEQAMKSETTMMLVRLLRALVAREEHVRGMMGPGLDTKWCAHQATLSLRRRLESVVGAERALARMEQRMTSAITSTIVRVLRALVANQEQHVTREMDPGLDARWCVQTPPLLQLP